MYYIRLKDDRHNRRWKVREAVSLKAAVAAVHSAMASGSIGSKDTKTPVVRCTAPGPIVFGKTIVLADVIRVNSDNTEAVPYGGSY